jgi:ABC-type multidrug transport system ATPase subunit
LLDNLTVYEMLAYTSELKNPMSEPFQKKRAKVEMVIQQLGLNGCRGVRIGNPLARGISGEPSARGVPDLGPFHVCGVAHSEA